jgi:hypothetical protein
VPQDLTVCDPYYILPITAGCLTFLTLELGTETGQSLAQSAGNMKNYMRVAAFAVIPITVVAGFPNAVLIYWVTQASVSLVQSVFFRFLPALLSLLHPFPPFFLPSFSPSLLRLLPPTSFHTIPPFLTRRCARCQDSRCKARARNRPCAATQEGGCGRCRASSARDTRLGGIRGSCWSRGRGGRCSGGGASCACQAPPKGQGRWQEEVAFDIGSRGHRRQENLFDARCEGDAWGSSQVQRSGRLGRQRSAGSMMRVVAVGMMILVLGFLGPCDFSSSAVPGACD